MQRRTFLMTVGGAVTTGAAALGSGALTQVDADRTTDVQVVDDSDGLIGLDADTSSNFISETNGAFEINLNGSGDENATGVNPEAVTTLVDAFSLTNQSGEATDVTISIKTGSAIIQLTDWTETGTWAADHNLTTSDDLLGQTISLSDGEGAADIDFVVTSTGTDDSVSTITISADNTN